MKRAAIKKGPPVYCSWQGNRTGVLLEEGPQQSRVLFDDDRDGFAREAVMINAWFARGFPRVSNRVKLKRVQPKRK